LREEELEEVPAAEEVVAELEVPEVEAAPVEEAVPAEVAPVEEEEMPAWLRILREEELEEPTLEEVLAEAAEVLEAEAAPVEEVALAEAVPVEEEEVPAWLRILREEELEEAPVEEIVAEAVELPEVEEEVPIAVEAVAEEVPEEAVPLEVELVEAPSTIAEYQARLEIEPKDYDTRLTLARAYHQEGDREAAFDQYGRLIRSGRLLEMVIEDLERVSREAPDQSDVWQLLGDVYVKADHLKKALDAYQEALARL
jgi:tetratricopeptide (TPR) repeat protein